MIAALLWWFFFRPQQQPAAPVTPEATVSAPAAKTNPLAGHYRDASEGQPSFGTRHPGARGGESCRRCGDPVRSTVRQHLEWRRRWPMRLRPRRLSSTGQRLRSGPRHVGHSSLRAPSGVPDRLTISVRRSGFVLLDGRLRRVRRASTGRYGSSPVAKKRVRSELASQCEQALPVDVVLRGKTRFEMLTLMPVMVAQRQIGRRLAERLLLPA